MPHKKNPILSENLTGLNSNDKKLCCPCIRKYFACGMKEIFHILVLREILAQILLLTLDFALVKQIKKYFAKYECLSNRKC